MPASASTGVELVQRVQSDEIEGGSMQFTTRIQEGKVRVDYGPVSSIIETKSGEMVSLMHDQKMFVKMPGGLIKDTMAAMGGGKPEEAQAQEVPKFEPTGRTDTIAGFASKEYKGTEDGQEFFVWFSKDAPVPASLKEVFQSLEGENDPFKGMLPMIEGREGLPLRVETTGPDGTFRMDTLSIKEVQIPEKEFAPPADYKSFEMPKELGEMLKGLQGNQ